MSEDTKKTVQTTGHAWDGDLQEFNNPLPTWWLWGFYATVVFAVVYWVMYPTMPLGKSYTKGVSEITYVTSQGKEVTSTWNTRALFEQEMQLAREAQAGHLEQLKNASYADPKADPEKSGFAFSMAKVLFADNCAACHQAGGSGIVGLYPNLADDAWLWGGSHAQIQQTLENGRQGNMTSFKKILSAEQISDAAEYVLSLSGHEVNNAAAKRGGKVFSANCAVCHGADAKGQVFMGSANLTDSIWTIADVPNAEGVEDKKARIMKVIRNGVSRQMPAWKGRLSDTEIKILTFYVHELGGGK